MSFFLSDVLNPIKKTVIITINEKIASATKCSILLFKGILLYRNDNKVRTAIVIIGLTYAFLINLIESNNRIFFIKYNEIILVRIAVTINVTTIEYGGNPTTKSIYPNGKLSSNNPDVTIWNHLIFPEACTYPFVPSLKERASEYSIVNLHKS